MHCGRVERLIRLGEIGGVPVVPADRVGRGAHVDSAVAVRRSAPGGTAADVLVATARSLHDRTRSRRRRKHQRGPPCIGVAHQHVAAMAKGIFDSKAGSGYDDEIVAHYHFPRRYLKTAEAIVGDLIVYREPGTGGGRAGYIAVARVARIDPNLRRPGHFYARVDSYLPFDTVVPLRSEGRYFEASLRDESPVTIGHRLQGRSVRVVSHSDFAATVRAGLGATLAPVNAVRLELDPGHVDPDTLALVNAPTAAQERQIVQLLMNRKIRDASFRRQVLDAYDNTCAVTGLRIVNGGGKAEAQAAHIWAVQDGGPAIVQNGVALSATAHWLFDRHLIALTDECGLLVSHNKVPADLRALFQRQLHRIRLPHDRRLWPNPAYTQRHREAFDA